MPSQWHLKKNWSQHLKQRLQKVKIQKKILAFFFFHCIFVKRFAGCMPAGVSQSAVNTQASWRRLIIPQGLKITKKIGCNWCHFIHDYYYKSMDMNSNKDWEYKFSAFIFQFQNRAEGYLHVKMMDNVASRTPKIWTLSLGVTVYCTHRYWPSEKFYTLDLFLFGSSHII